MDKSGNRKPNSHKEIENGESKNIEKPWEKHWLVLSVILTVFVSGITYQVLNVTVIEPLNLRVSELKGEALKSEEKPTFHKTEAGVPASGAFIVGCQNEKPAMLGVIHRERNQMLFSPPAGKAIGNETASEAAVRETREETGYPITIIKPLGKSPSGNTNFSLLLAEIDRNKPANPQLREVVGLLWADPEDIPPNSWRFPEQREWIVELFEQNAPVSCAKPA